MTADSRPGPLRIAIDGQRLRHIMTGVERYGAAMIWELRQKGLRPRVYSADRPLLAQHACLMPLWALAIRPDRIIFPMLPPSPLHLLQRSRVVLVVHDTFLLQRLGDLNWRARFYLRPCFRAALLHVRRFIVNSVSTRERLSTIIDLDRCAIHLLRPIVENVFELSTVSQPLDPAKRIEFVAIGTLEPRKNYGYAGSIIHELRHRHRLDARLTIYGRDGWGGVRRDLEGIPGLRIKGFRSDAEVGRMLNEQAHFYISTSKDEGLGLPALEVQHGHIPVIATDIPAFRETMKQGAILVPPGDAEIAASLIADHIRNSDRYAALSNGASENIRAWNTSAEADWSGLLPFLAADLPQRSTKTTDVKGGDSRGIFLRRRPSEARLPSIRHPPAGAQPPAAADLSRPSHGPPW